MVASPKSGGVSRHCGLVLGLCLALASLPLAGQTRISLDQLESRKGSDYSPRFEGQSVVIRGVVATDAYHLPCCTLLAIEDAAAGGVLQLPSEDTQLYGYHPGDELEVEGNVSSLFGAVTVIPARITVVGRKRVPEPLQVAVQELI